MSSDYSKEGLCTEACLEQARCQLSQLVTALGPLLHKDLLLVLLDYLLVLLLAHGHELYQLVIYMNEMMMQHLVIWQQ